MKTLVNEIRDFIKWKTRLQRAYLWGDYVVFKPVVLSKIFGDGLQIIGVSSMDQRPKYWIVRIDSNTDIRDNFDIETILTEIEEEFGRVPEPCHMNNDEFKEYKKTNPFFFDLDNYTDYLRSHKYPAMLWGGGRWWTIKNFGKPLST